MIRLCQGAGCGALSASAACGPLLQGCENGCSPAARRQQGPALHVEKTPISRAGWRACSILALQMQMRSENVCLGSGVRLLGLLQLALIPLCEGASSTEPPASASVCLLQGHPLSWLPFCFVVHTCRLSALHKHACSGTNATAERWMQDASWFAGTSGTWRDV